MYAYALNAHSSCRGQRRVTDPLILELQKAVSCHVSAGDRKLVLWWSSQCFLIAQATSWVLTQHGL